MAQKSLLTDIDGKTNRLKKEKASLSTTVQALNNLVLQYDSSVKMRICPKPEDVDFPEHCSEDLFGVNGLETGFKQQLDPSVQDMFTSSDVCISRPVVASSLSPIKDSVRNLEVHDPNNNANIKEVELDEYEEGNKK